MANPDLLNYIDQARKSGATDDQIRQGLLQSGWQANDVNEAFMNAPGAAGPQIGGRPMVSKTLLIILAVAALAVGGYFAGAYYMANYQDFYLWPYEAEAPIATFTPRPSPTPTPDPTAGWKTYTNAEYGFEFKYPGDWNLINLESSRMSDFSIAIDPVLTKIPEGDQPFALQLGIYNDLSKLDTLKLKPVSLADYLEKYSTQSGHWFSNTSSYNVAGVSGYKTTAVGFGNFTDYYFEKNSLIFEIVRFSDKSEIDLILSTFKFTK